MSAIYGPGDNPTLVDPRGLVMVEPGRGDLLRRLHGKPLTIGVVMDVLASDGLGRLPDFAGVIEADGRTTVLLRGRFAVRAGREVLDGADVTTWIERHVGVDLADGLVVGQVAAGESWPVEGGVVLAAWVRLGDAVDGSGIAASSQPADAPVLIPQPPPVAEPRPVPEPASEPDPRPEQEPESVPTSASTSDGAGGTYTGATMAETDSVQFDAMFGLTNPGRRPEDAAVRQPEVDQTDAPSPPAGESADLSGGSVETVASGMHDGRTVARRDVRRSRAREAERPALTATLVMSSGDSYVVERSALVGRSPRTPQASGANLPVLVIVDDPYVSGTHLEVVVDGTDVLVTDVSSNGTVLEIPGRPRSALPPQSAVPVRAGSVLVLSDDSRLTVEIARSAE